MVEITAVMCVWGVYVCLYGQLVVLINDVKELMDKDFVYRVLQIDNNPLKKLRKRRNL